jgi:His/Glu/Gln/Arg/opine family amino acid ABC transporter permease subunit
MQFHFEVVFRNFSQLLGGAWVTLYLSGLIILFGSLIGLVVCFARLSKFLSVRAAGTAYVQFIRGTPLLVQLLYIYYGLPLFTGMALSPVVSGVTGMSINIGAYLAEIFRSGILSVERGQFDAAKSLGMPPHVMFIRIIGPQALRVVIPPLGNMFISLVKDTSLLSIIAVAELVRRAELLSAVTFRTMEIFTVVALMYFCMTYILAHMAVILEARLSRGLLPMPSGGGVATIQITRMPPLIVLRKGLRQMFSKGRRENE